MTHTETTEAVLNFPHQDDNNWLMIDVGGVKAPQYPSPLEVKMLLTTIRKETLEECIKLSDEIELREPDGGTKQWMAFKGFRNTMRDRLQALKK